jgi:hypothetical protein
MTDSNVRVGTRVALDDVRIYAAEVSVEMPTLTTLLPEIAYVGWEATLDARRLTEPDVSVTMQRRGATEAEAVANLRAAMRAEGFEW